MFSPTGMERHSGAVKPGLVRYTLVTKYSPIVNNSTNTKNQANQATPNKNTQAANKQKKWTVVYLLTVRKHFSGV